MWVRGSETREDRRVEGRIWVPETQSWQGIESEVLSGEMMEERTEKKKKPVGSRWFWFPYLCWVGEQPSELWSGLPTTWDYPHPGLSHKWECEYLLQVPSLASENNAYSMRWVLPSIGSSLRASTYIFIMGRIVFSQNIGSNPNHWNSWI